MTPHSFSTCPCGVSVFNFFIRFSLSNTPFRRSFRASVQLGLQFPRDIEERDLFELVLHRALRVGKVAIEHGVDVPPNGAGGIGMLVEVKEVAVHALHRAVHVVQRDIGKIADDARPAAARSDLHHARRLQTEQRAADDDGIDLHARRDEIGSRFLIFERMNDEQRVHRHREAGRYLHKKAPFLYFKQNYSAVAL